MKKKNSIDTLVESLYSEFSKITNFQLTQTDPIGNKFFHFIVRYISELNAFQNLFIQYYLPASLKSITDFKKELKHSKYRAHFNFDEVELKENYYETVRLGYVGVYHKYESYLKNIIPIMDDFFKELDFEEEFTPILKYIKSKFDIDLRKTTNKFYVTEKINWISNCTKHYEGYPIKEPIPLRFKYRFNSDEKIRIESKEFKEDVQNLIIHNRLILQSLFLVGFHQFLCQEFKIIKDQLKPEKQKPEKVEEVLKNIEKSIKMIFS